jgi:hypothetical protein
MADRIFKGRLITTGDIHEENRRAFPEATEDFKQPHRGGLHPYQMLYDIFTAVMEHHHMAAGLLGPPLSTEKYAELERSAPVREINGSIWISGDGCWIKIDKDGSFEIGTSGV